MYGIRGQPPITNHVFDPAVLSQKINISTIHTRRLPPYPSYSNRRSRMNAVIYSTHTLLLAPVDPHAHTQPKSTTHATLLLPIHSQSINR